MADLTNGTSFYKVERKSQGGDRMTKQKTDWGDIVWMDEQQNGIQGLQVGMVTLPVAAHQPKHIHYEEQVIYVTGGQALSKIDGVRTTLKTGDIMHWQAGVEHEITNTGDVPFQHLLISNPVQEEREQLFPEAQDEEISPDLIYIAVEAIRTQFLETLHYGYVIFDSLGNLILQSRYMTEYCEQCCHSSKLPGKSACMLFLKPEERKEERIFKCPYGMEVFHYPIYFKERFLGYIECGYIRHDSSETGRIKEVYDVPESVVIGIKALMKRILKAIRNYCEFEQFRKSLMEKEMQISSSEEVHKTLMRNLQETQYAMTDLKINHHFLFNTLNSMASMALDSGSMNLYQSIVDLSKMFHYTLKTQNSIVTLEKEVTYVQAYLQLQKLRYGDDLEMIIKKDQEALNALVPFNFLQPVVENVFTHGFKDCIRKKIRMEISRKKDMVEIQVVNSGQRITEEMCVTINYGIQGNTSHGLAMVYRKLQSVFGENFDFYISVEKNANKNTCFIIRFPFQEEIGERSFV